MCTTVCGEHFFSVGVDLWGEADESTLSDENPPLDGFLAGPLQVSGKGLSLWIVRLAVTYTEIQLCTLSWCDDFLSVNVDSWGPADESTLMDETLPWEGPGQSLCPLIHVGLRQRRSESVKVCTLEIILLQSKLT